MHRRVEPELLDQLPTDDPLAVQSRRDLRRVNSWMGHYGIMARALKTAIPLSAPSSLIELGAGDGSFLLEVGRRLRPHWSVVKITLLDQQNLVQPETLEAFQQLGWPAQVIESDVFDWMAKLPAEPMDVIVTNLFLHHFSAAQLAQLLAAAAGRARAIVALEPRRSGLPFLFSHLLGLIGCNRVTRHDAVVSVRAGFDGKELSGIWRAGNWSLSERRVGLFSHLFVATDRKK